MRGEFTKVYRIRHFVKRRIKEKSIPKILADYYEQLRKRNLQEVSEIYQKIRQNVYLVSLKLKCIGKYIFNWYNGKIPGSKNKLYYSNVFITLNQPPLRGLILEGRKYGINVPPRYKHQRIPGNFNVIIVNRGIRAGIFQIDTPYLYLCYILSIFFANI